MYGIPNMKLDKRHRPAPRRSDGGRGRTFVTNCEVPVTGLQLPLISAGGTSTATTLLMIGIMANAASHEPEAWAALRAGRDDRVNRLLRLPLPAPYVPTRTEALRDRQRDALMAARRTRPSRSRPRRRQTCRGRCRHPGRQSRRRRLWCWPAQAGPTGPHTGRSASRVSKVSGTKRTDGGVRGSRWSSPAVARRATSNRRWQSPTP